MLKNLTILNRQEIYLNRDFAISFKNPEALLQTLKNIDEEVTARGFYNDELVIDIITLKIICYKVKEPIPYFISLTYDDSSLPDQIIPKMHKLIKKLNKFFEKNPIPEGPISDEYKGLIESECSSNIDDLLMLRPAKISIIGNDFVGKSSICEMLQSGKIPKKYKETTNLKNYKAKLFGMPVLIWDIPDSSDLSENVWKLFILGSDAVILVLDSSRENVKESKLMVDLTDKIIANAELLIVANKQDTEEALSPKELESIIQNKVFPFVGNKPENSIFIQKQAAKLLEIKADGLDYSKEDFIIQRND